MYSRREQLIRRHILDVIRWGAKISRCNLLDGNGRSALDVGCAYGYGVDVLQSLGYNAFGVDISRYAIRRAKKTVLGEFIVCDVQKGLPFEEDSFDLSLCIGLVEHLHDPLKAIMNVLSCCRGIVLLTTPNRFVEKPIKKIIGNYDETHINVRSESEWRRNLSNIGCSSFHIESVLDASLMAGNRLLFFKSFKAPILGLDLRIIIKK